MGEVIDFPVRNSVLTDPFQKAQTQQAQSQQTQLRKDQSVNIEHDPYYLFLHNVLTTADSCGFELPVTVEIATELVYRRTRKTSQLAKMMDKD